MVSDFGVGDDGAVLLDWFDVMLPGGNEVHPVLRAVMLKAKACHMYFVREKILFMWFWTGLVMIWLIFEMLLALFLIIGIMVWTLRTRKDALSPSDSSNKEQNVPQKQDNP